MNGFEKMTVAVLLSAAVLAGVACSDGGSDSGGARATPAIIITITTLGIITIRI